MLLHNSKIEIKDNSQQLCIKKITRDKIRLSNKKETKGKDYVTFCQFRGNFLSIFLCMGSLVQKTVLLHFFNNSFLSWTLANFEFFSRFMFCSFFYFFCFVLVCSAASAIDIISVLK